MRFLYLIGLLLVGFNPSSAQQSASIRKGYADFVVSGSDVWLLTRNGGLERGSLRSFTATPFPSPSNSGLSAISKDTANALVAVDSSGRIWRLNLQNQQWSHVASSPHKRIHGLVVDSHNQYLLISQAGIWSSATQETYFPADSLLLNDQITQAVRTKTAWREKPVHLLETNDQLWVGFNYGEWGGSLFVFDTHRRQYIRLQLGDFDILMNPIVSIVQGLANDVYVLCYMGHMMSSSSIARFSQLSGKIIFKSEPYWKPINAKESVLIHGQEVGPAAFNPQNNQLYFYSYNGIFSGDVRQNLSTVDQWTRIAQPNIERMYERSDGTGYAMSVLKIAFSATGQLLLLTEQKGLGQFDGKTFRFIKLVE